MKRFDRIFCIVLDGVGVGEAPDAAAYGDEGANSVANAARAIGGLRVPNLQRMGLGNIENIQGVPPEAGASAYWGRMMDVYTHNFFELFPIEGEEAPPRGHIFVFRTLEEWEKYNREKFVPIPGEMVLAYYNPLKHEMVLRYEEDKESMFVQILWHEATHLMVNVLTRPGAKIPMWIQDA